MAELVVKSATDSNLNKLYRVRTLVASPAGPVGSPFCASAVWKLALRQWFTAGNTAFRL